MKDVIKKAFLLGLGVASMTKSQTEKIVKGLVKNNSVTIKEGKDMLKKVKKHAAKEAKKVSKFAQKEVKRAVNDIKSASKSHTIGVKKGLKTIDKELSARGKKTLKNIIKKLPK